MVAVVAAAVSLILAHYGVLLWRCPTSELVGGKSTGHLVEHELVEGLPGVRRASMAEHPALVPRLGSVLVVIRPSTNTLFVALCLLHDLLFEHCQTEISRVSRTTQCSEAVLAAAAVVLAAAAGVPAAAAPAVLAAVHSLAELLH